jgi:hypothetical protein
MSKYFERPQGTQEDVAELDVLRNCACSFLQHETKDKIIAVELRRWRIGKTPGCEGKLENHNIHLRNSEKKETRQEKKGE